MEHKQEQNTYKNERELYLKTIKYALPRLTWGQMDYFARRVQTECESTVGKAERKKYALGVNRSRESCGYYILQNSARIPNFELSILAGEMLKEIEGNDLYGVYKRDNWKDEK